MKIRSFPALGFFCLAVGCFSLTALTNSIVRGQTPAAPAAAALANLVAVVDLPKVFEGHPTFKSNLQVLQQQVKQIEKEFEAKQTELSGLSKQLSDLSPDKRRLQTHGNGSSPPSG